VKGGPNRHSVGLSPRCACQCNLRCAVSVQRALRVSMQRALRGVGAIVGAGFSRPMPCGA
jgi:hypothetical protein